jgi:hypothetical protein
VDLCADFGCGRDLPAGPIEGFHHLALIAVLTKYRLRDRLSILKFDRLGGQQTENPKKRRPGASSREAVTPAPQQNMRESKGFLNQIVETYRRIQRPQKRRLVAKKGNRQVVTGSLAHLIHRKFYRREGTISRGHLHIGIAGAGFGW